MAKLFGSQIDLQRIPVIGLVPEAKTTEPTTPVNGQLWFDTTAGVVKVREAGAWQLIANAAGGSNPTGPAGGDLTGSSYPNPVIAANAVTTAKILDSNVTTAKIADLNVTTGKIALLAVTDAQVATANKDGAVGTASMRTLGTGAQQALAGNSRLNYLTAANGAYDMGGNKLNNLGTPTVATDAATMGYVDGVAQGLDVKASVRCASTAQRALTGLTAIDGVTPVANDRVLLKNQTAPAENGIWLAQSGAWTRALDMDAWAEVPGAFVFVESGTAQADSGWVSTAEPGGTLGTTGITWTQFSGAGAYTAGAGMTQTGTTFDVIGTTNRITVAADAVDISTSYVGQASITTLGTITTGTWTGTDIAVADGGTGASTAAAARTNLAATGKAFASVTALSAGVPTNIVHSLGSVNVHAQFQINATGQSIEFDWKIVDSNTISVTADVAYAASAILAVVVG